MRKRTKLPLGWTDCVKATLLHANSLAHYAIVNGRGTAAHHSSAKMRPNAENEQLRQALALATAKLRTKDSRSSTVSPRRRRRYSPTERLAILQYRAARGESLEQTVQRFVVTAVTISSWHRRVDEQGRDSLVKLPQSVNKCPEAVTYLVRRLRVLCPTLGRRKIATMLTRAGFT